MATVEAGKIEIVSMDKAYPIDKLNVYEENPRMNDAAVAAVERSMIHYGFVSPIIADESGRICAGHTRYKSALKQSITNVPAIICRFPNEEAFVGYNIADNQTAAIAEWNIEKLSVAVVDLDVKGVDLQVLGFNNKQLNQLKNPGGDDDKRSSIKKIGDIKYHVMVECDDENQQRLLIEQFTEKGLKCRALML